MLKQIRNILLISTLILLISGCAAATATPTAQVPASVPVTMVVITATSAATATAVATTAAVPTNTQVPPTNTPIPATKVPAATSVPGAYNISGTPIESTASIIITSVKATSDTKALITWTAKGPTTNGFRIYYSTTLQNPFFDGSTWVGISDPTTRSAYMDGTTGTTYYYRICQFNGTNCDFYSNSYTFTFPGATSTP